MRPQDARIERAYRAFRTTHEAAWGLEAAVDQGLNRAITVTVAELETALGMLPYDAGRDDVRAALEAIGFEVESANRSGNA